MSGNDEEEEYAKLVTNFEDDDDEAKNDSEGILLFAQTLQCSC